MAKTVLIVEDDPKSMKLTYDLLSIVGYFALPAVNGAQAVVLAKSQKPDLILMDIQLPVMDGMEATRQIKADPETGGIPIIATTAYAMKGDEEKVTQAGFDGYITKPINIHELLKTVEMFIGSRNKSDILH
jgi:two-component system, cell cycle response regulator DivK